MKNIEELKLPTSITDADRAMELVRIWIADHKQQVAINGNLWEDPAAWGLMLVDLARHVSNAYESQGYEKRQVLERIYEAFHAEWDSPTDDAQEV